MTAAEGGYSGGVNRFAGLTTNNDVSNNNMAKTIAGTISSHMANLLLQTAATINANKTQVNASLQQMEATQAQLQQQQQQMMQQMVMMSFTPQQVAAPAQYIPAPIQYNSMFQQQQGTWYAGTRTGGRGRGGSRGGRSRRGRSGGRGGMMMPAPMPFIGGTQMIPYLPIGAQQQVQHPPNP